MAESGPLSAKNSKDQPITAMTSSGNLETKISNSELRASGNLLKLSNSLNLSKK